MERSVKEVNVDRDRDRDKEAAALQRPCEDVIGGGSGGSSPGGHNSLTFTVNSGVKSDP